MPNIPPLITHTPEAQSLYYERGRNAGIASGLTFTAGTGVNAGAYVATISVPRITARSVLLANVQSLAAADIAAGTWLIASKASTNTITFLTNAAPVTTAAFQIAWYFVESE
jgi:hypothetical protein